MDTASVKETLHAFASHTGFKRPLLDVNGLTQKYVTVHLRSAHPALVYPYIGDDYTLLKLRTHSPPLDAYTEDRDIDPIAFAYVMKHGYENRPLTEEEMIQFPSLQHLKENLMPKPVGEEAWKDYERDDHWKARAYLIGLQWKNTAAFPDIVQAVYGPRSTQEERDAYSDFMTSLLRYEPYEHMSAEEMGHMIAAMDLGDSLPLESNVFERHAPFETCKSEFQSHAQRIAPTDPIAFHIGEEASSSSSSWMDIANNPFMQSYRKQACINATFSPKKTLKQMIFASLKIPLEQVPNPTRILPATQPVDETLPHVPKEAWPFCIKAMAHLDVSKHELNPEAEFFQDLMPEGGTANALDTIETVLTLYHPECEADVIDPQVRARLLKQHPKMDSSIISSLMKM